MTEGRCPICKLMVLEDVNEYKKKFPDEIYIQCPVCGFMMRIKE